MNEPTGQNDRPEIAVIIPAYNEAASIGRVLADIPKELVSEVIVVDNASSDATAKVAGEAGATVLSEARRGYGHACQKGVAYLQSKSPKPDIVVFLDGDYADYPEEMVSLTQAITRQSCDLAIGARVRERREPGAMPRQQVLGNRLAALLIRFFYGHKCADLGPFRAIRFSRLIELNVSDGTYGWPVEMQLKAIRRGLKVCEVPVGYRSRIGRSKVSGTFRGSVLAGYKILSAIFKYRFLKV